MRGVKTRPRGGPRRPRPCSSVRSPAEAAASSHSTPAACSSAPDRAGRQKAGHGRRLVVLALPRSAAAQHYARHVLRGVRHASARAARCSTAATSANCTTSTANTAATCRCLRWVARQLARRLRARPQAARRVAARDGALLHGFPEQAAPVLAEEYAALTSASSTPASRRASPMPLPRPMYERLLGAAQLNAFELTTSRGLVLSCLLGRRVDVQPRLQPWSTWARYQPRGRVCGGTRYVGGRRAVYLARHESALRGAEAGAAAAVWVRHRLILRILQRVARFRPPRASAL